MIMLLLDIACILVVNIVHMQSNTSSRIWTSSGVNWNIWKTEHSMFTDYIL
jgi:hypothetical protein